jgi:hypothetical protein
MIKCELCKKNFTTKRYLEKHHEKTPNCIYKCHICLYLFSSKRSLVKHESIVCKQRFECNECNNIYISRYKLKTHNCEQKEVKIDNIEENKVIDNSQQELVNILKNAPNDKQIIINNITQNIYNNNKEINEINNNSKNNVELNNNSKNKIKNNILDSNPKNFRFDYVTKGIELEYLKNIDDYEEDMADKFMYEEKNFRELHRDIVYKYDKEKLQTEGMKILFTKLQKDPTNRNVMIRKSKSGKCYIYNTEWVEEKLQKIITKVCNKLCDTLYEKETSMNHFFRLVLGSQPRRYTELRKHIEEEIIDIGKVSDLNLLE